MSRPAQAPTADGPTDARLTEGIEAALASYLETRRRGAAAVDPAFADAAGALAAFATGGGKRLRPIFAWWGWRGAGGQEGTPEAAAVLRAVSALELIQASALIHDDLIDASATRRGRPTVHVTFAKRHADSGWNGRPARFGAAAAILLGDLALAWADDMIASAGLSAAALERAREPWQAMRTELLGGQFLDVLHQASGDMTTRAAMQINRYKTAAYTVERPLHLGAAFAGAPADVVAAYRRFGAEVGVAFQLRDDLLGVYGDPKVTGKPTGDDLREGKRTMLVALALERAERDNDTTAHDLLTHSVGNPDLTAEDVEQLQQLFTDLGAVQAVEQRIAALTGSALDSLSAARIAEPAATQLAELAVTATRRQR